MLKSEKQWQFWNCVLHDKIQLYILVQSKLFLFNEWHFRFVLPTLLMIWPTPDVQCMIQDVIVMKRMKSQLAQKIQGKSLMWLVKYCFKHFLSMRNHLKMYIVDYNCSGVWCANVSHLNVTATPWLKIRTRFVPMVTCVRYPAGHINIPLPLLSRMLQDCVCQPRFPPGCSCDPYSANPDSSCSPGQTCKQCKCLGKVKISFWKAFTLIIDYYCMLPQTSLYMV